MDSAVGDKMLGYRKRLEGPQRDHAQAKQRPRAIGSPQKRRLPGPRPKLEEADARAQAQRHQKRGHPRDQDATRSGMDLGTRVAQLESPAGGSAEEGENQPQRKKARIAPPSTASRGGGGYACGTTSCGHHSSRAF